MIRLPDSPRRFILAAGAAALLAACTSLPAPPEIPAALPEPEETAETLADLLAPHIVPVAALSPNDPGILALARTVAEASLTSFMGNAATTQEDARLKSALTQALTERHGLGLVVLDGPCTGVAELDTYAGGITTGDLAADIVAAAALPASLKTTTLADLLARLRGWNAVFPDAPVRLSGRGCETAAAAAPGRPAIFWGLSESPADMSEKTLAASALGDTPADDAVWLVQTFGEMPGNVLTATGWIDLRALPDHPLVAAWRETAGRTVPALAPDQPWSADIVIHHALLTPAEAY